MKIILLVKRSPSLNACCISHLLFNTGSWTFLQSVPSSSSPLCSYMNSPIFIFYKRFKILLSNPSDLWPPRMIAIKCKCALAIALLKIKGSLLPEATFQHLSRSCSKVCLISRGVLLLARPVWVFYSVWTFAHFVSYAEKAHSVLFCLFLFIRKKNTLRPLVTSCLRNHCFP